MASISPNYLPHLPPTFSSHHLNPPDGQNGYFVDQGFLPQQTSNFDILLARIYSHQGRSTHLSSITAVLELSPSDWLALCQLRESKRAEQLLLPHFPRLYLSPPTDIWALLSQLRRHPQWSMIQKDAIDFIIHGRFTGQTESFPYLHSNQSISSVDTSDSPIMSRQHSLVPPAMTNPGSLTPQERSPRTPDHNRTSPGGPQQPRGRLRCPYPGCKHDPFIHDSRFKNHLRQKHGCDLTKPHQRRERAQSVSRMSSERTVRNFEMCQNTPIALQPIPGRHLSFLEVQTHPDVPQYPDTWSASDHSDWATSSLSGFAAGYPPEMDQFPFIEPDSTDTSMSDYSTSVVSTTSDFGAHDIGKPHLLPKPLKRDRPISGEANPVTVVSSHVGTPARSPNMEARPRQHLRHTS